MTESVVRRAVVIDDDSTVRSVVATSLGIVGDWSVEGFESGEVALAAAEVAVPDLFVLDVMMPTLSGVEVFEQIKANARLAEVPVVFLTAKAAPVDAAEYLALGALGVIVKPFDPTTLAAELEHILEKGHEATVHWPSDWHDTTE